MNTVFIERTYVVAGIMGCKSKYLHGEEFVTNRELNVITREMQQEFNRRNIRVVITNEIEPDFFIRGNPIKVNESNGSSFDGIENLCSQIPWSKVTEVLTDDKLICQKLLEIKQQQIQELEKGLEEKKKVKVKSL